MASDLGRRRLKVHEAATGLSFEVALFEGAEPSALSEAVAARVGYRGFLTLKGGSVVVPLSSSLPDATELTLHRAPNVSVEEVKDQAKESPAAADIKGAPRKQGKMPAPDSVPVGLPTREASSFSSSSSSVVAPLPSDLLADSSKAAPATELRSVPLLVQDSNAGSRTSSPGEQSAPHVVQRRRSLRMVVNQVMSRSNSADSDRNTTGQVLMSAQMTAMERFSRVTTDLANERTLLAWMRTCLAAIRTVFAYYAVEGKDTFWSMSALASELSMAALVVVLTTTGYSRYARMKDIIGQKNPPAAFGRLTVRYVYVIMAIAAVSVSISCFMRGWVKK